MPELKNNLPGALSIEGDQGHTYHVDGQQSIEITDEDVEIMRSMEAVKLLESSGGITISAGADHPVADPVDDVDDGPLIEPHEDSPEEVPVKRGRGRPPKKRDDAD